MVNVPRIHCHSAYKHYHMFHNNSGSSYGNSIFNTTYNFNGGTMCGGGFWGGLLGGFGMGLGAGLMNLFGGLFGGGMGFGFPMGGMFGGGFGFGGFPMLGGWGGFGGGSRADGAGGKEKETKTKTIEKEKIVEKEVKNKDTKLIGNYSKEIDALRNPSKTQSVTKEELQNLYNKINKSKSEHDNIEEEADTDSYTNLLNDLKQIAENNCLEFKDGKFVEKVPKPINDGINNLNVNKANMPDDNVVQPQNQTLEQKINALKPEEAIQQLGNRIVKDSSGKAIAVKVPRNYKELLLAKQSGLKIQFCKNTGLTGARQSQTISGTIVGEIEKQDDGTYKVVVQDGGKHTLSFKFENSNKATVTLLSSEGVTGKDKNNNDVALTDVKVGTEYYINNENDEWAIREDSKPAIGYEEKKKKQS